ncbi:MAG TPA: hypothetical protein VHD81_12090 [Mycobacteriales bacterium]|nr:hypothetical protein [Mycobacteriales bacterium]
MATGCHRASHDPPALTATAKIQPGVGHCSKALFSFKVPDSPTLARIGPTSVDVCQLTTDGQLIAATGGAPDQTIRIAKALSALPEWHGRVVNCPAIPPHPMQSGFLLHYGSAGHVFVRFGPSCGAVASLDGYRFDEGLPADVSELLTFAHGRTAVPSMHPIARCGYRPDFQCSHVT